MKNADHPSTIMGFGLTIEDRKNIYRAEFLRLLDEMKTGYLLALCLTGLADEDPEAALALIEEFSERVPASVAREVKNYISQRDC